MTILATFRATLRPWLSPALRTLGLRPLAGPKLPAVSDDEVLQATDVPTRVDVRADETFLVNEEPFFPIGLYYAEAEIADASGAGLARLRAMGFNTIFFSGGLESAVVLDRIASAGLRVWYRPPGELHGAFNTLKQVVVRFGRHPAVLLWEMDDEPILNKLPIETSKAGCALVHRIDPFHPILCNQWFPGFERASEVSRWAELADVHGFGIYPVPLRRLRARLDGCGDRREASLAIAGEQVALWRRLAPGKPVIPVLQAFAWNALEDGDHGYPTLSWSRFMAYHCIVNGAKGLHHYGVPSPARPYLSCGIPAMIHEDLDRSHEDFQRTRIANARFWTTHAALITELAAMSDVFTARNADWAPRVNSAADPPDGRQVEVMVKALRDSFVLLVVNPSDAPTEVQFTAPPLRDKWLNAWGRGEGRQADAAGRFSACLGPYDVRIYSDQVDRLKDIAGGTR